MLARLRWRALGRRALLPFAAAAVTASVTVPAEPPASTGLVAAAWVGQGPDVLPRERRPRAEIAISAALAQTGKPYRYGSQGPDAFDCSGLTGWAWRAAGVRIPRSSSAQYAALPKVPLSEIRPGDLVFAPGHVGLYIGDGLMVHAPRTGRRVEVAPLHRGRYGAVRPA